MICYYINRCLGLCPLDKLKPLFLLSKKRNIYFIYIHISFIYLQFSSVAQSRPTLCDLVDCSTPVFPVHHRLLELAQIHVHWVGDAIQPSHPLLSPSPAFNLSQLQGLFIIKSQFFASGGQSIGASASASVLPMNIQVWFPLGLTGLISLQSKGLSGVFSNTTVQNIFRLKQKL